MPIPDFKHIYLPLLKFAYSEKTPRVRDAKSRMADVFQLSAEERQEMLPSGGETKFGNRVRWAQWELKAAGLLEAPQRGRFRITARGRAVLAKKPTAIDSKFLSQFPEYRAAMEPRRTRETETTTTSTDTGSGSTVTPEESMENAYRTRRKSVGEDLLQSVLDAPPDFFERLVVDLLVRMGYGGSREEAGKAIGGVGDEGIDGIIKEDRLGLDVVYIQAKRWKSPVGRPDVQQFAGALQGKRARKGVLITTSAFSAEARTYVQNIEARIVLMDGSELVEFMMDHDVGVTTEATYVLKKIDSDYFPDS